jgi:hypothetical protein
MDIQFSDSEITPQQRALADRIEHALASKTQFGRRQWPSGGNGPAFEFSLRTTPADLTVQITVFQDSVQLNVNEARVMIEAGDDYDSWADDAVCFVSALVSAAPLRIRIRQTLILRRPTGAIYLEGAKGGGWNGDLSCCRGAGSMHTFENWYEPQVPD